jgi:tripartite ATP-independent transporter DctP family solute receptor
MKKAFSVFAMMAVMVTGLLANGSSESAGAKTAPTKNLKLKYDLTVSLEHPWGVAASHFKDLMAQKSGDTIVVEIYPSSTSGSEADSLAGMQVGTTDMTMTGGSFAGYAKSAVLLEAPWAYNSERDVQKMMESEIGKQIVADFEKAGYHMLWYQLRAARQLTSNVPITTPADLKGRKMRMSGNPLHTNMWNKAGAVCSAIALNETFNALSQGVVEMQENPYDFIYDNSFYEVQKYTNETSHVYSVIFNVISAKKYASLTADQKRILDETSAEMQTFVNDLYFAHKDDYKQKCVEKGMQINTNVDREAFKQAMMPAIQEYLVGQGDNLWSMYQEIEKISSGN